MNKKGLSVKDRQIAKVSPSWNCWASSSDVQLLCRIVANRSAHLYGQLRWDFAHAVGSARLLGALLQHFLLGFAVGDKIAIHSHVSTIHRLFHPTLPERLQGDAVYQGGKKQAIKPWEIGQIRGALRTPVRSSPYWEMIMSEVLLMVKVPGRPAPGSSLRGSRMKLKL